MDRRCGCSGKWKKARSTFCGKSDAVCALRNRDPDEILFNYVLKLSILKFRLFLEEKKIIKKINKWISLMLSDT